jgi:hypothetical protein
MSKLAIILATAGLLASASAFATGATLAAADTDKDGAVSAAEAKTAGISDEQFTAADKDANGSLSAEEFAMIK